VGNKHIKAEKKAHGCLVEIQKAIQTEQDKLQRAAEAAEAAKQVKPPLPGDASTPFSIEAAATNPAIFTADGSGIGQAAH
jgi:hypothetical protein